MRHHLYTIGVALAMCACALPLAAQGYAPAFPNPQGTPQLVAVYISSSNCVGNRAPGLHQAIDSLKLLLQARASATGRQFRAVGVALDWSPDSGLAYLRQFGAFDELDIGRNWFGLGVERFIWADSTARPVIPQIVIYEQELSPGPGRARFGPPSVLRRVLGGDSIVTWVRAGALVP